MGALSCRNLTVSYGGVTALTHANIDVDKGQLVGLIGPNGAGKTTFIDAVTGFARSSGSVTFLGRELNTLSPHRRVAAGLGRTFQNLELFEDLTVAENLLVAAEPMQWWAPVVDAVWPKRHSSSHKVEAALKAVGIEAYADANPSELPNGLRKLVAVARAMAAGPSLILLDEPASGLDTDESARLGLELRALVDSGVGLLLVDHDMGLVLSVSDYVYVLDFGRIIAEGPPEAIRADERVISAYLGTTP